MSRVRKIYRKQVNYYLVDACFLANKYLPIEIAPSKNNQKNRVEKSQLWWKEIDKQFKRKKAKVYIPAACIAESFKVLAKRCFHPQEKWFKSVQQYNYWRNKLSNDISTSATVLRSFHRNIKYHDIEMGRDIIISVDRFYELFMKYNKNVGIIDLTVAATAKYLMDFFDIPKDNLHIITLDKKLREGIKSSQDLPNAYDPTMASCSVANIFV